MSLKRILRTHSNPSIASAAGVHVDIIKMLRKGKVDQFSIKQLPGGRAVPSRKILEQKILEGFKRKKFFN